MTDKHIRIEFTTNGKDWVTLRRECIDENEVEEQIKEKGLRDFAKAIRKLYIEKVELECLTN